MPPGGIPGIPPGGMPGAPGIAPGAPGMAPGAPGILPGMPGPPGIPALAGFADLIIWLYLSRLACGIAFARFCVPQPESPAHSPITTTISPVLAAQLILRPIGPDILILLTRSNDGRHHQPIGSTLKKR